VGEASDGNISTSATGRHNGSQAASGPMDLLTALWYVNYTGGQLGMFERAGRWYLRYGDGRELQVPR
jgi:hypothetical protein